MTRSEQARRRMRRGQRARPAYMAGSRGGRRAAKESPGQVFTLRLVVCGGIFVLLVVAKLLFPEAMGVMRESVGSLLGRDADFRAAFAAMGRAVSGEGGVGESLQDAYVAVFDPESRREANGESKEQPNGELEGETEGKSKGSAQPDKTAAAASPDPGARLLRYTAPKLPEPKAVVQETVLDLENVPVPTAGGETDGWSWIFQPLPDNASMELRNLGFEHCTPVLGKLNSSFGWREHPVTGGNKFHYGLDLGAAEGTDILAFADGEVYASGESSTLGNYVMLRHEGGYITLYGHCSRVVVTSGTVTMGQKIAEVGSTGQVTGPHLHFELHDGDLYLNPIYYVEVG